MYASDCHHNIRIHHQTTMRVRAKTKSWLRSRSRHLCMAKPTLLLSADSVLRNSGNVCGMWLVAMYVASRSRNRLSCRTCALRPWSRGLSVSSRPVGAMHRMRNNVMSGAAGLGLLHQGRGLRFIELREASLYALRYHVKLVREFHACDRIITCSEPYHRAPRCYHGTASAHSMELERRRSFTFL